MGHQRIITIVRFFDGTFDGHPFKLKNINPKWEGRTSSSYLNRIR